ncbi:RND transporter [Cohaesibacter celericrescens]|uniref:RND transporter n=2 Tax=Cohaesibacter celericrescens TaxID=2067669 RepID=A0A2N5XNT3_9HYPH|nr:RND transporter [Cohaesibacter celericrescens]
MGSTRPRQSKPIKAAFVLITMSLLVGCAVGPDYQSPSIELPSVWSGAKKASKSETPALADWWAQLNDPLLNELIEEAVEGNFDVATSKAKIREARASYRQAGGELLPTADGSASATRAKSNNNFSNTFKAGFDASWEVDLFGANKSAKDAARYGLDAAREELRSTLLTLIGDVASNYVTARGYQARLSLAYRTVKSQKETATLTDTKFKAGASSGVDVENAAGQAANTAANIPDLVTAYSEAVHRISVLTGKQPSALQARLKKTKRIPRPKLSQKTGIPADILINRPDVRLAERQYAQYTAKVATAEANRYPSVSLTGNIASSAAQLGDLGKSSSISWSFGPSLSVPLFNAGKLKAAAEVAQAQRDQYFIGYKSAVLTALEDVENAIVALTQERKKNSTLSVSTKHYRQAYKLSSELYKSGSSSFLDLLEAQRSLYSAEDSLLQSQVAIATDYIALNKALGGGWNGTIDSTKPEIVDASKGPRLASRTKAPVKVAFDK